MPMRITMLCLLVLSISTAAGTEPEQPAVSSVPGQSAEPEQPVVGKVPGESAQSAVGPMLGEPAPPELVAAWDIDIMPNGAGLPAGSGSVPEGRQLYARQCMACHGPDGQGGSADALAGADPELTGEWPEKTVGNYWPHASTLFDFIRRAMPMTAPGSLSADETYALVAYLLHLNDIVDADTIMDRQSLPQVHMPNREGFLPVMQ